MTHKILPIAALALALSAPVAWAHHREGHHIPPGHAKLAAPASVECTLVAEGVSVVWAPVEGAFAYQVESTCDTGEKGSVFLTETEVVLASECTITQVNVRALPAPKHASQPLSAGGPKGRWSAPCELVAAPTDGGELTQ